MGDIPHRRWSKVLRKVGRPSKLTDAQWQDVLRRRLRRESYRSLARDYGVTEAAIRLKISQSEKEIKRTAKQVVAVSEQIDAMPPAAQVEVFNIAQCMQEGKQLLISAGMRGARVADRLNAVAVKQMEKVDINNPGNHGDEITMAIGCTKGADLSGQMMMKLLVAGIGDDSGKDSDEDMFKVLQERLRRRG